MKLQATVVMLAFSTALAGADRDFERIVKAVESHYGVKQTHIPLMGVANLFTKVARPAGTKSFKIAIFENMGAANGYGENAGFDGLFDELAAGGLRPMIRTHSRHNAESTYICTGEVGKWTRMLVATFDRNQATVVEVEVNMDTLLKVIASPEHAGQMFGQNFGGNRDRDW
ncbi:MAG TPA: hypothetical protein VKU19_18245 [Bryobacteraceae bacterium]|nr:hypothetical protein [Bryobacteraceae bacterium]